MMHWFGSVAFLWWWLFFLLPLPWLLRRFLAPVEQGHTGALKVPFFAQLATNASSGGQASTSVWWRWALLSLIWVLLVVAAARPTLVGEPVPLPAEGRDVMLAIDLSGSMDERDLTNRRYNRLAVVKAAADEFISRREGDRMGLIFFSDRAYLQAPLTFDRQVVRDLLKEAQVGLTGQQTAIGDAIAVALKRLRARDNDTPDSRVLVLLTDGTQNAGVMQPLQAAQLAKKLGIKIYTIGVGSQGRDVFGRQRSDLDEGTLTAIAEATGGQYFRATDAQTLDNIYREINQLVPAAGDPIHLRPQTALFHYPAGLALVLLTLLALLITRPWQSGWRKLA